MKDELVLNIIRSKIKCFINRRHQAYQYIIKAGYAVPDFERKSRAIALLKVQIEASKHWSLAGNLNWISAMRNDITALLPYEFHDDPKQKLYRKHILDLLKFCDDLNTKSMFNQNQKAYA